MPLNQHRAQMLGGQQGHHGSFTEVLSQPLFTSSSFCPHLHEWCKDRWEIALISGYNNNQAREWYKLNSFLAVEINVLQLTLNLNEQSDTGGDREAYNKNVWYFFYHGETRLHACTNSLNLSWGKWDVVPVEIHDTTIRRCFKLILPWVAWIHFNFKEKLGGVL